MAAMVDVADWKMLRAHLERGGLIIVDRELELVAVGVAVTADDVAAIKRWVEDEKLAKPSADQIAVWDDAGRQFRMLIVSPYILIQEELAPLH